MLFGQWVFLCVPIHQLSVRCGLPFWHTFNCFLACQHEACQWFFTEPAEVYIKGQIKPSHWERFKHPTKKEEEMKLPITWGSSGASAKRCGFQNYGRQKGLFLCILEGLRCYGMVVMKRPLTHKNCCLSSKEPRRWLIIGLICSYKLVRFSRRCI